MLLKENDRVKAPVGPHAAVCVDFIDKGIVATVWDGENRQTHKCRVQFEIDAINPETGKRYTIGRTFTVSLGEKASLRKFLEQWRGKPFSDAERKGFDTENLIGVPALIQVAWVPKGDTTYDNIDSVMGLPKGMARLTPSKEYVRVQDRPAENGDGPPSHHAEQAPLEEETPF